MIPLYSNVYHNIILSFSSHLIVPECSLLSKSLVPTYRFMLATSRSITPLDWVTGHGWKYIPLSQSVCFILTFLLFTLFLSILMLFKDCQRNDRRDTLAQYLHLKTYHGKDFYLDIYPSPYRRLTLTTGFHN